MKDFALGEVGLRPDEFMRMSWADWQRAAQGHILRHARYLDGARKISYYSLIAAGAKRVREYDLFRIITDPERKVPKIDKADLLTQDQVQDIIDRLFDKKNKRHARN